MKTKITVRVNSDLLREAKVLAVENGMSVSQWLGSCLEDIVNQRKVYARARKRALARLQRGMELHWEPTCSRYDLHER
jgi:hypothetical protein